MGEIAAARAWLKETLEADDDVAAIVNARIWPDNAPPGPTFPYIVFHLSPAKDTPVFGGPRSSELTWLVKAVGEGRGYEDIVPLDAAVDAALEKASGTSGDYEIVSCIRTAPFAMPELDGGKEYRHLGGYYQLTVQLGD